MPVSPSEISSIDFSAMIGGPAVAVVKAQAQAAMSTVNFIKAVGFTEGQNGAPGTPIYVDFKYPVVVSPYQPKVPAALGSILVTKPGHGYLASAPPVVTVGAPGTGGKTATAVAVVSDTGEVTAITFTDPGSGYTSAPSLTIDPPPAGTPGAVTATASVNFIAEKPAEPAKHEEMLLQVPILTMLPIPSLLIQETNISFNAKIHSLTTEQSASSFAFGATASGGVNFLVASAKLSVSTAYKSSSSRGDSQDRTYSMSVNVKMTQAEMPAGLEKMLSILEKSILGQPSSAPAPLPA